METETRIPGQADEILKAVQSVCDDFDLQALKNTLHRVKSFAGQNQYLDIAVLGQFKAGKSSFLNAFVHQALLPVGNIPVTSVITRMSFGPQTQATVTFLDGTTRGVPIEEIDQYVSETNNPENCKNVLWVDIEVPALSDIKAIRLVDTPGIGSVWKHNTETTTGWFPETGGVLFLISAEKPISENELSLLQEIYLYSPEITIVITKTDLFTDEQIKEIEAFTARVLRKTFDRDFPIYRYSAYVNPSQYNEEIAQKVFLPLARNRDENFAKILEHKLGSLVNSCLSYLEVAYQASLKADAEKKLLADMVLDEHLNSSYVRRELLLIIASYKETTRERVRAYLDGFKTDVEARLNQDYEASFLTWRGNLYQATRQFEEWLKQALHSALQEILLQEEISFELLNAVKNHLGFYLRSFRERLRDNLERVLGVEMQVEQWEIIIGTLKKPSISISRSFDSHLDMLWFLFPMFIYRNVFKRYFFRQIPYEVDKNFHRLTSNVTDKVNKEMDNLMAQALGYMNEELRVIDMLLSEDKGDSNYILERMNQIQENFNALVAPNEQSAPHQEV